MVRFEFRAKFKGHDPPFLLLTLESTLPVTKEGTFQTHTSTDLYQSGAGAEDGG